MRGVDEALNRLIPAIRSIKHERREQCPCDRSEGVGEPIDRLAEASRHEELMELIGCRIGRGDQRSDEHDLPDLEPAARQCNGKQGAKHQILAKMSKIIEEARVLRVALTGNGGEHKYRHSPDARKHTGNNPKSSDACVV